MDSTIIILSGSSFECQVEGRFKSLSGYKNILVSECLSVKDFQLWEISLSA